MTLVSDLSDLSDLSDQKGAPVFALTGYAVASHVIPRGFAVPLSGLARAIDVPPGAITAQQTAAAVPAKNSQEEDSCIRSRNSSGERSERRLPLRESFSLNLIAVSVIRS